MYQEKVAQLDVELKQIEESMLVSGPGNGVLRIHIALAETHPDYVGRIAALNVEMAQRIEVIGLYARLELQSLDVATHFDKLLAERTLQDKKRELRTSLMSNLLRRKQRLEALQKQSEQIEGAKARITGNGRTLISSAPGGVSVHSTACDHYFRLVWLRAIP